MPSSEPKVFVAHLPITHYELLSDGRGKCIYIERETGDRTESFGVWRLFGKDKLGFQSGDLEYKFLRLADGTIRSDENPDFDIVYARESQP